MNSEGFEKGLKGLGNVASKGLDATKKAITAVGVGIAALGAASVKASDDCQKALNTLQAQTGATASEMDDLKDSLLSIYGNNYGESFEDVAESLASVKQQTGLAGDELEEFTKDALVLRDTFDMDVTESTRAANMMMEQFGVTGEEAFNLIAQGAQNGLDKNDNLLDSINEYSVHFKQLGFDADDMFNMLSNGAATGVFDIDKLGDAVKEFGIRAKDGSDSTKEAFAALGLNADELTKKFAGGGQGAKDAFNEVNSALANCDDKVLQNQVGVALWGTMWEDMGAEAVAALSNTNGVISETNNAMQEIDKIKYDSIGEAFAGIGRQIEAGILVPLGDSVMPMLNEFANWINSNMPTIQSVVEAAMSTLTTIITNASNIFTTYLLPALTNIYDFAMANLPTIQETFNTVFGAIGTAIQTISDNMNTLIPILAGVVSGFAAFQAITTVSTLFTTLSGVVASATAAIASAGGVVAALGAAFTALASPVAIAVAAIGVVVAAGVALYQNNEDVRNAINECWEAIKQCFSSFVSFVQGLWNSFMSFATSFWNTWGNAIKAYLQAVWNAIGIIFETAFNVIKGVFNAFSAAFQGDWSGVWDSVKSIVSSIWNGIVALIGNAINGILNVVSGVLSAISSLWSSAWNAIKNLLSQVWSNITKSVSNGVNSVKNGISNICKGIVNTLTKVPSQALQIGKNIVEGLIKGIISLAGKVGNAISNLCNDAVNAATSALGIKSPSRVFKKEVGQWIPKGLAKGIEESAPEASKATTSMCNSVLANGKAFLEKQKAQDKAWTDSKKEQYEAQKTALYDYIERKKEANQLSLEDEKYIYNQLLKAAKGNLSEMQEIKKKLVEADEEAYQKRYENSKQFIADKKYFNQLSLQDELAAYERMKDYSKGHADETKEIEKEIYRVKKEIKEKEIQDVKDANSKILDELKDRVDKEKAIITGKRDAQLDALQDELDAMDKAEEERQNNMTIADYETSLQELQQKLIEATNPEEQQRVNEQIFEKQKAYDEWKYQQQLKDKKEAIRAQMDEVRAQADQEIETKENEYEQQKAMLEANQATMIAMIQNGEQQVLNVQDASAVMAMGINKSLTEDKQNNLNQQYEAVIDNENKSAQAVEDACVEMYRKNYKMGTQMANGIADGILNQTWRAVKAIGMMCDKMVAEAQKKLDIHSPSRVFRKMGEYVDQGFSGGIDDGSDGVIGSMSSMCKKLTSAVNVDDLVGKMSAAVNGEVSITGDKFATGANSSITNTTTTTNNNSSMPITVNNYGSTNEGKDLGRELGNQVSRRLRGRGIVPC